MTKQEVVEEFNKLSQEDQRDVLQMLPTPDDSAHLRDIWMRLLLILGGIAGLIVVAAIIVTLNQGDPGAAWVALTAIIGGLIGLLAPSPAARG